MLETGTSGLMSGEGKPPAANRSRSSALPRLYGAILVDVVEFTPVYHCPMKIDNREDALNAAHSLLTADAD